MNYIELSFNIRGAEKLKGINWIENLTFSKKGECSCRINVPLALNVEVTDYLTPRNIKRLKKLIKATLGSNSIMVTKICTSFTFKMKKELAFEDSHGVFLILAKIFRNVSGHSSSKVKVIQNLDGSCRDSYIFSTPSLNIEICVMEKKDMKSLSIRDGKEVKFNISRRIKKTLEDFSYEKEDRKSFGLLEKHLFSEEYFYQALDNETNRLTRLLRKARRSPGFNHKVFLYEVSPMTYECLRLATRSCYSSRKSREAITTSFRKSIRSNKQLKHLLQLKPEKVFHEIVKQLQ